MAKLAPNQQQKINCLIMSLIPVSIAVLVLVGVFVTPYLLKISGIGKAETSTAPVVGQIKNLKGEPIGISDGVYSFDTERGSADLKTLKMQASAKLKAGDKIGAVALWHEVTVKDTNDAEALIYQENQLVLASGKPYITLIVGTMLTGDNMSALSTGRGVLQGAYVAQKEYNDNLKLKGGTLLLRLFIANSGSVADYATEVAQQIVEAAKQDKTIVGVMGWPFSSRAVKVRDVLSKAGIPMVSPTASSDDLVGISRFFFRVVPSNKSQAIAGALYVEQQLHAKRVALFVDPHDPYSSSLAEDFSDKFKGDGNEIVVRKEYTVHGIDNKSVLPTFLRDALSFKPDLIYFAGYASDLAILLTAQLSVQVMGGDALYELGGYPQAAREGFNHLHFTAFAYPDEWIAKGLRSTPHFFAMYRQDFDPKSQHPDGTYGYQRPTHDAMLGYDATFALIQGCNNALNAGNTPLTPDLVQQGLSKITGAGAIQGVSGQISFGSNGDPIKKAVVVLYVDGGLIKLSGTKGIQGCYLIEECS